MVVDPGEEGEYERRHRPVWPELQATLVEHGVRTYSIFLDRETNDLFAYVEVECEEQWNAIASTDVCRRWWRHMRDLMPTNADSSPMSRDLREVFHLSAADVQPVGAASPGKAGARRGPAVAMTPSAPGGDTIAKGGTSVLPFAAIQAEDDHGTR